MENSTTLLKIRNDVALKLDKLIKDESLSKPIEEYIYEWVIKELGSEKSPLFRKIYLTKICSVYSNLDPKSYIGNQNLLKQLKDNEKSSNEIVNGKPWELCPEKWEELLLRSKATQKFISESEVATDQFICGKCKMNKCSYSQAQIRSADEPMTTFVKCLNCGYKWNF